MNKLTEFIFTQGNKWILRLFYLFFSLAYLFALMSPNLKLGDNNIFGTSTTLFLFLFLAGIILFIALYYSVPVVKKLVEFLFVKKQIWTATILFGLVIFGQILVVQNFHPVPGWDVNAIHMGLLHPENPDIQSYFSLNQNNIPILLVQVKLFHIFGSYSWLFLDYITLIFVDISAVMLIAAATIINRKNYAIATYLQIVLLAVFPWIVVPYTDSWVLPLVSGMLLTYVIAQKTSQFWMRSVAWVFVALFAVGCYFMKPSTVIPLIAIIIIELLNSVHTSKKNGKKLYLNTGLLVLIFSLTFLCGYKAIQQKVQSQQQITIDQNQGIPMIHFINTGMSRDGAYDPQAALKMVSLPSKQEKTAYSKEQIKKRLKDRGFFGYIMFLFEKHRNNTADGTFSWGKEGTFFQENPKPKSKIGLTGLLKHSLFIYGDYIANFRFIAQLVWLTLLSLIFFGWKGKTKVEQMLRLSLIGGFMFLLIFEGGRSRYLIQFMPLFLLLATLSAKNSYLFLQGMFKKISYSADDKS